MIEQGALFKECDHRQTVILPEKRGSAHFAKETCKLCKKFLRWIPKPETIEQQNKNLTTLALLVIRSDLGEWERHFIQSISGVKNLSPKQQKALDGLRLKFLESKQ